jgi:hypothetical protein
MNFLTPERRAALIGKIDAILTAFFVAVSLALVEFVSYIASVLPTIDSNWGEWNWLKVPLSIFLGALIKGKDRAKHENPDDPDPGIVNVKPLERLLGDERRE